jgi:hypothetical protein
MRGAESQPWRCPRRQTLGGRGDAVAFLPAPRSAQSRRSGAVRGAIRNIAAKPDYMTRRRWISFADTRQITFSKQSARISGSGILSRHSVSAEMTIRWASVGTSTTHRFTNQCDGDFSNMRNAGDWRSSRGGCLWSEAEPACEDGASSPFIPANGIAASYNLEARASATRFDAVMTHWCSLCATSNPEGR